MKQAGIICEYNPLHTGHAALLDRARHMGDAVVCVMSGHFTQRGDVAILDKYARAEAAVRVGADLVLELPFPFACASAPFFAEGALAVLDSVGVGTLLFGSETGDLFRLWDAAHVEIGRQNRELGAAVDYFEALGHDLSSNDILGVSYLRTIEKNGYAIEPALMKRLGDGYREASLCGSEYASAMAIRRAIGEGGTAEAKRFLPQAMLEIWEREQRKGRAPVRLEALEKAILYFWRTADPSLGVLAELGGGLCERLIASAKQVATLGELFTLAATKKYTNAHIRRAVLYGMLGVTWADLESRPAYTNLLAASRKGCDILASLRKKEQSVPIVTKPSDVPDSRASVLAARADALYTLALPTPAEMGDFMRKNPFLAMGLDE